MTAAELDLAPWRARGGVYGVRRGDGAPVVIAAPSIALRPTLPPLRWVYPDDDSGRVIPVYADDDRAAVVAAWGALSRCPLESVWTVGPRRYGVAGVDYSAELTVR